MKLIDEPAYSLLPSDLYEQATRMSRAYEYLFCIENLLRLYLSEHPSYSEFVVSDRVSNSVKVRKQQEQRHKWLSARGDSDIFYMDFSDLGSLITNNWDYCKEDFPTLPWIVSKIEDLTNCRNLIAHNSSLDQGATELIRVHFNSITRQLGVAGLPLRSPALQDESTFFVIGIDNSIAWTVEEAEKGVEYVFQYPGEINVAPRKLSVYFEQVGLFFKVEFNNSRVLITPDLNVGREYDEDHEVSWLKGESKLQIGQYDIDGDGVKELFICIQSYSEKYDEEDGVEVNVFKFYPPAFPEHSGRPENWELLETMTVKGCILGEPKAFVEANSVTIPRNHRGFYFEWTWVKDKFMVTGDA